MRDWLGSWFDFPALWPLFLNSDKAIVDEVQKIAAPRGISMATAAMAWLLNNPGVTSPIIGTTKPKHLADAVAALDLELTDDEIASLEQPYTPRLPTYLGGSTAVAKTELSNGCAQDVFLDSSTSCWRQWLHG